MAALDTTNAPTYPTPLWILALFIALSEVTTGAAAIATDGVTRLVFAVFAVAFPLVVLAVFIWLLLRHPANLYGPSQYTAQTTTIEEYATALSRENRATNTVYSEAIGEAIEAIAEAIADSSTPDASTGSRSAAVLRREISDAFDSVVTKSSITVDRSSFREGADAIQIPVAIDTTVGELLDSIYFAISPAVEPFTYAESWMLARGSGTLLDQIGTQWARARGMHRDERSLREVKIEAGTRLWLLAPPFQSPDTGEPE